MEGSGAVDGWAGPLGPEGTLDPRHRHHWPFSSSPASPLRLGLPTSTATSSFLLRAATMSGRVLLQSAVILWLVHVAHTGGEWKAELEAPPMENTVISSVVWIVWWVWRRPVLFKMQDVTWLRKQRMQPFSLDNSCGAQKNVCCLYLLQFFQLILRNIEIFDIKS